MSSIETITAFSVLQIKSLCFSYSVTCRSTHEKGFCKWTKSGENKTVTTNRSVWESRLAAHSALLLRPPPVYWMTLLLLCVMVSASDIWGRDSAAPDYSPLGQRSLSSLNGCCQRCSWVYTCVYTWKGVTFCACLTTCVTWFQTGTLIRASIALSETGSPFVSVIRLSCYVIPPLITSQTPPSLTSRRSSGSPSSAFCLSGSFHLFSSLPQHPLALCLWM